eukprot:364613-Chlamydomonas_euryale.AAC.5
MLSWHRNMHCSKPLSQAPGEHAFVGVGTRGMPEGGGGGGKRLWAQPQKQKVVLINKARSDVALMSLWRGSDIARVAAGLLRGVAGLRLRFPATRVRMSVRGLIVMMVSCLGLGTRDCVNRALSCRLVVLLRHSDFGTDCCRVTVPTPQRTCDAPAHVSCPEKAFHAQDVPDVSSSPAHGICMAHISCLCRHAAAATSKQP